MIVYNTTYTVPVGDARNFVIWVHQSMLPKVADNGLLARPRLLHVLSHKDPDTECFSLQFEVEQTSILHKWYTQQGHALMEEMLKTFDNRVVGFSTMMEVIEEN